jgi:hypothetical protein
MSLLYFLLRILLVMVRDSAEESLDSGAGCVCVFVCVCVCVCVCVYICV